MEQKEDFFITVSSNASSGVFPNNSLTQFSNKCPQAITLDSAYSWRVGLVDIQLPINWNPFPAKDIEITVKTPGGMVYEEELSLHSDKNLSNAELGALFEEYFSPHLPTTPPGVAVVYNQEKNRISFLVSSNYSIKIPRWLLSIFGISEKQDNVKIRDKEVILFNDKKTNLTFEGEINIYNDYNSLWVYSNLCAWRMVGDALVPCNKL